MPSPLTSEEIIELFGSLRRVLSKISAQEIRNIAGAAGFDLGQIPDGLTESGTRRPPILSGIDGQWSTWNDERRARVLRHLAEELVIYLRPKGMDGEVNAAILKNGFRFENGDFVPVNAIGEIEQ